MTSDLARSTPLGNAAPAEALRQVAPQAKAVRPSPAACPAAGAGIVLPDEPNLFSIGYSSGAGPNARTEDPVTSHIAGQEIEQTGIGSKQRAIIYGCVIAHPGLTAREVEAETSIKAHKRLPELRDMGYLANREARRCKVSGKLALTWWPK